MSFNTTNKKIHYIQNKEIDNTNEINSQSSKNKLIEQNINVTKQKNSFLSNFREIETEWVLMEYTNTIDEGEGVVDRGIGLSVELLEIPEVFIPFIRVEILYRNVNNTDDTTIFSSDASYPISYGVSNKAYYKSLEDLGNGSYNVKICSSLCFIEKDLPDYVNQEFEAKLKVIIYNPYNY